MKILALTKEQSLRKKWFGSLNDRNIYEVDGFYFYQNPEFLDCYVIDHLNPKILAFETFEEAKNNLQGK